MSKKDNISSFQIAHSKIWADGEKYFSLFEKHIPELEAGHKVLVYDISNLDFICKLMSLNKDAEFWIYGNQEVNEALRVLGFSFHEVAEDLESKTYNIPDMKFDCIIMNPPYERNLHLKILAEAITHLKDETSTCVNLSPVRWLQDPLAKYKKNSDWHRFQESVSKHIERVEVITSNAAQEIFQIGMQTDIAIYMCCIRSIDNIPDLVNPIVKRTANFCINHYPVFDEMQYLGWRVRIPYIIGGKSNDGHGKVKSSHISKISLGNLYVFFNGYKDGKPWYDWYQRNQFSKTTKEITQSIKFNSELEATNFIKQFNTNFVKYNQLDILCDVQVAPEKIIWMGDSINPRTGKKGYEGEWTDSDFYTFFNITPDEQKIIESTMEKYK